jgi:hypothetical protein
MLGMSRIIAITEANCMLYPLAEYRVMGRVFTKGSPTKKVPVNSSRDVMNTNTALASKPGAARGRVILKKALVLLAPTLLAASSRCGGIDLNVAFVIHTPNTRPTRI